MNPRRGPLVVVADDDAESTAALRTLLASWGCRVAATAGPAGLFGTLAEERPALLLLEIRFGEGDGIGMLRRILPVHPGLRVVMLAAVGSIDSATAAIKHGADDYLTKPLDRVRLRGVVRAALDGTRCRTPRAGAASPPILGASEAMSRLRSTIGMAAASDATVLILGESGTGKELVVRAIHEQGPRRDGPFVPLNVAALPHDLVESTLFGHAKGAFTGAGDAREGCCGAADGGTLFLDEIGEMEIGLQAKLLRFLQERSFQRVGQTATVPVDVRVVAATNRSLAEMVALGRFRDDLYYRLDVVSIEVPPLRDRREDIPLLARHFLDRAAVRAGRAGLSFSSEALVALSAHDWPGNVRELENFVERLTVLNPHRSVFGADVAVPRPSPGRAAEAAVAVGRDRFDGPRTDLTPMARLEEEAIVRALAATRWRVREAARALGLSPATVYRRIKRYGLTGRDRTARIP